MAYIYKGTDGKWYGPYPNKVGDYCGNHHPDVRPCNGDEEGLANYLADKRFGRPGACPAGSSAQMAAAGHVGLYLTKDHPHVLGTEVDVDTDVLTEAVVTGDCAPRKPFDLAKWVANPVDIMAITRCFC